MSVHHSWSVTVPASQLTGQGSTCIRCSCVSDTTCTAVRVCHGKPSAGSCGTFLGGLFTVTQCLLCPCSRCWSLTHRLRWLLLLVFKKEGGEGLPWVFFTTEPAVLSNARLFSCTSALRIVVDSHTDSRKAGKVDLDSHLAPAVREERGFGGPVFWHSGRHHLCLLV